MGCIKFTISGKELALSAADVECVDCADARSRAASDAALIERLTKALTDLLNYSEQLELLAYEPGERDAEHSVMAEARAALAEAEGRKGLCQNGDGNPVLRALLCAECIKRAQETGAFL